MIYPLLNHEQLNSLETLKWQEECKKISNITCSDCQDPFNPGYKRCKVPGSQNIIVLESGLIELRLLLMHSQLPRRQVPSKRILV